MIKKVPFKSIAMLSIVSAVLILSGCSIATKLEVDKAGMQEMKNVALIGYSVPTSISYRDNPKTEGDKGFLQTLSEAITHDNGEQAATIASNAFVDQVNDNNVGFRLIKPEQLLENKKFTELNARYIKKLADDNASILAGLDDSLSGKALSFMASMLVAPKEKDFIEGASPINFPSFGLIAKWNESDTALLPNSADETAYIKEAISLLGVDGALIINDPGMSFSCDVCVGGTGSGSTGSAFLATLVDRDGDAVLKMRQWFVISDGNAAMLAYAVNPLQHDDLFQGHGTKMGRLFSEFYNENK